MAGRVSGEDEPLDPHGSSSSSSTPPAPGANSSRRWVRARRAETIDPPQRGDDDHVAALGLLAAGVARELSDPLTSVLCNLEHVARRLRAVAATAPPGGDNVEPMRVEAV